MNDSDQKTPPASKSSPARMRKILSVLLSAVVVIFLLQNLTVVEVDFLAWTMRMPRAILVLIVFLVGIAVGFLLQQVSPRR